MHSFQVMHLFDNCKRGETKRGGGKDVSAERVGGENQREGREEKRRRKREIQ